MKIFVFIVLMVAFVNFIWNIIIKDGNSALFWIIIYFLWGFLVLTLSN